MYEQTVDVNELVPNDVIVSHDDLDHCVTNVRVSDHLTTVDVQRSDGSTYSAEFDPGTTVTVRG